VRDTDAKSNNHSDLYCNANANAFWAAYADAEASPNSGTSADPAFLIS